MLSSRTVLWLGVVCILLDNQVLQGQECSSPTYTSEARSVPEIVYFTDTTSCGFWGWSRCARVRSTIVYRTVYVRRLSGSLSTCCDGYRRNTNGDCEPICEGECTSPHYCESPSNCICIDSGYSGPNCRTPVCRDGCPPPRTCIAPDTCMCLPGFTGESCKEDIDECANNRFCEQVCNNIPGSYSCSCLEGYQLANDQVQCIGGANASVSTVNSSAIHVIWEPPYWDTGNMTRSYNLTCFLPHANGSVVESVTEIFNRSVEVTVLSLNISAGYTCCTSVITDIGDGPVTCGTVSPLPEESTSALPEGSTSPMHDGSEADNNGVRATDLSGLKPNPAGRSNQETVKSQPFIIGLGTGGGMAVLLFIIFLVLVSYTVYRFKRSHKTIVPPSQAPLSEEREYKNELYEMHTGDSTLKKGSLDKKISMDDGDDLEYNTAYLASKGAVENEYATVRTFQYHYVKH